MGQGRMKEYENLEVRPSRCHLRDYQEPEDRGLDFRSYEIIECKKILLEDQRSSERSRCLEGYNNSHFCD